MTACQHGHVEPDPIAEAPCLELATHRLYVIAPPGAPPPRGLIWDLCHVHVRTDKAAAEEAGAICRMEVLR